MSSEAVVNIDIQGKLPKVASGKVRDLYAIDDDTLLFVASDRISAYDVIMENVSHTYQHLRSSKSKIWIFNYMVPTVFYCLHLLTSQKRAYPGKVLS
jgi:phosphoribosylaminoimidazole-succinocarboxamide synthase